MERKIIDELVKWHRNPHRKPLILQGVRQCGKTWAVKEFGKRFYEVLADINFDEHPEYKTIFENTRDVSRIFDQLRLLGYIIEPGKTLIFFDEIQECPNALGLLKYIEEKHPEYHVVCAGSLLGVKLAKGVSFPVGKVDFLNMQPMSFSEFLTADESGGLADYIRGIEKIEAIPGAFAEPLTEKLKAYFIVGGMPEAVASWAAERNIERVDQILSAILMSYDLDFSKHPASAETQKTSLVWNSLPTQLSKENKKFIYKLIKDNARAREYESSIQWLSAAAMIYRVNRVSGPGLPIAAYDDLSSFKLYASDVGLLRRLAKLSPSTVSLGDKIFTDFKGAFAENYILAALSALFDAPLRYWSIQNPTYEVDFILQDHSRIIPIEVKSSGNVKSKGLKHFRQKYAEKTELSLRFSLHGFHYQDGILNIPLFLADQTDRLLEKI